MVSVVIVMHGQASKSCEGDLKAASRRNLTLSSVLLVHVRVCCFRVRFTWDVGRFHMDLVD